jgi:hypothetical protein
MATTYGSFIPGVTDGLVLYLDAAKRESYPGSGTTWIDLSGNGNNGTLTNGPTHTGFSKTSAMEFDGVDDVVVMSISSSIPVNTFTYDIWCIPTTTHQIDTQSTSGTGGTSGQRYLVGPVFKSPTNSGAGISAGTNGISVYEHSDGYLPALLVSTTAISSVSASLITIVYNNKQPTLYINGTFDKNGLTSTRTNVFGDFSAIAAYFYGSFQGKIHYVRVYNRALTASEVLQNYNALKGRFGL